MSETGGMQLFTPCGVPLTGTNLVEASAGTGKTYAITTLFVRLLLERELGIDRILVVTFTEAATAELRDRVRRRLREAIATFERCEKGAKRDGEDSDLVELFDRSGDPAADRERLEAALRNADLASIFTIHGFCHRVLKECAFESGVLFDADILTDARPLREEVVGDFWAGEVSQLAEPIVAGLLDSGFKLESCRALVDKATSHPGAPVRPERADVPEPPLEEFEQAYEDARAAWDETEIRRLMADEALNKNMYRETSVRDWCAEMSSYFETPPHSPRVIEKHVKFCASELSTSTKKGKKAPEHPFFEVADRLHVLHGQWVEAARGKMLALHLDLVTYARTELPRRKEMHGVLSFDDLLQSLRNALMGPSGVALARSVRRRFPAALIDEFQDTDPVQYEIFAKVWTTEDDSLFFVGDPKQAIYSFRGADVFAYMRAASGVAEDRRFTMPHNWRSDPTLVEAVNFLFARVDRPFLLSEIGYPNVAARPGAADVFTPAESMGTSPLDIVFVRRGEDREIGSLWLRQRYPDLVAAEISSLLRHGAEIEGRPIACSDIAVLTRTNRQAFEVQAALRRLRIPSVVLGDESVFESREAEELQRVLGSVVEPTNAGAVRAALATELLGVTANDLARMEQDEHEWTSWVNAFREWSELWASRGFVQMFRSLMTHRGLQGRLLSLTDGERRMTNLLHLMELLHTAATTQHLGPTGLLHWLAQQRANARARPEAAQIRLESDEKAVKITTVHRAKGLEYGVVYCLDLWDGMLLHPDDKKVLMYHDPARDNELVLEVVIDEGKSASTLRAEWEKLAENLRLTYVALTRAKHRCTVYWGARWQYDHSALGYLLHPQRGVAELGIQALEQRLRALNDDAMLAELRELATDSGGRIGVRVLDPDERGEVWQPDDEEMVELACRRPEHEVDRWWRTASFTQLAGDGAGLLPDAAEGRDRDETALDDAKRPVAIGTRIALADFPRGARAGNFFHDVLEHLDFAAAQPERRALVEGSLAAHGFDVDPLVEPVLAALEEFTTAPLAQGLRLADVPTARRLDEMEFHLPARGSEPFTRRRLARAFAEHPSQQVGADYAESLGRLRFAPLAGFLKGYIDLVLEHQGLWYVVDYKTNWLGPHVEDYGEPRLAEAMAHGHYYLQYHLYTVAVHRFLERRLEDYDFERCFGGVFYLFVRGMTPRSPGAGVFFERPPLARIEALSAALSS